MGAMKNIALEIKELEYKRAEELEELKLKYHNDFLNKDYLLEEKEICRRHIEKVNKLLPSDLDRVNYKRMDNGFPPISKNKWVEICDREKQRI